MKDTKLEDSIAIKSELTNEVLANVQTDGDYITRLEQVNDGMRAELETLTNFMEGQLGKIKESRRQRDAEQAVIDQELGKKGKLLS